MIYVLSKYDFDSLHGIYEGPDNLILDKIQDEFQANLDHRTLGAHIISIYQGPCVPYKGSAGALASGSISSAIIGSGGLASGSVASGAIRFADGSLVPDQDSAEFKQWQTECETIRKEWNFKYNTQVAKLKQLYPGNSTEEMYNSYLKKEYGFKEVAHKEFML